MVLLNKAHERNKGKTKQRHQNNKLFQPLCLSIRQANYLKEIMVHAQQRSYKNHLVPYSDVRLTIILVTYEHFAQARDTKKQHKAIDSKMK